jgi:hypothetical protein
LIHINRVYIAEAPKGNKCDMLVSEYRCGLLDVHPLGAECVLDSHTQGVLEGLALQQKPVPLTLLISILRRFYA